MNIKKVYMAIRHNTALKLRAIDSLHFARKCKARDYASPRVAESITTQAGNFFASKPTEYKRACGWNPEFSRDNSSGKFRVLENCQDNSALRFVGFADEIPRFGNVDHNGWYCDNFQSEVYRGAVWQLPARNGKPQYLAGFCEPWNDNAIISMDIMSGETGGDENRNDTAICEAARNADGIAESFAESARDEDTKFQAEQRIETARDEIREAREEHSAIVAEIRGHIDTQKALNKSPLLCEAIRGKLAALRETVAELRREIERLTDEPWSINL